MKRVRLTLSFVPFFFVVGDCDTGKQLPSFLEKPPFGQQSAGSRTHITILFVTDSDCLDELICFQRDYLEPVPGCMGEGRTR